VFIYPTKIGISSLFIVMFLLIISAASILSFLNESTNVLEPN